MRKLYTTLLLLMAAIVAVPQAWAVHTETVSLPWTPQIGYILGSAYADFNEYLCMKGASANNSGTSGWNWYSSTFRSTPSSSGSAANPNKVAQDSYLFLPPMEFEAGECYLLSFEAYSDEQRSQGNGRFRVMLAGERTLEGAQAGQVIVPTTTVGKPETPITHGFPFNIYFTAEKSGVQSIVFNCQSLGGAGNFYLYHPNETMKVKRSHLSLPQAPTDLVATPDATGRKEVTVSFKAPTLTVVGEPIAEMTYINVYVDGNRYERIENPVAGQTYSVTLKASQASTATVSVAAGNTHGEGDAISTTCSIGYELQPAKTHDERPEFGKLIKEYDIRATYHEGAVNLKWIATKGENVTYSVKRMPDGKVIADNVSELTASDPEVTSDYPANFQYELTSYIDGVAQTPIYSNVIGINNEMPYRLSFGTTRAGYETTFYDTCNYPFSSSDGGKGISAGYGTTEGEWFFTPSVILNTGKHYKIEVNTGNWIRPVHFEIKAGKGGNSPDDMTLTMLEEFIEIKGYADGGTDHDGFFTVPEDGAYFIGVKGWTETNEPETMLLSYLNIIEVDEMLPAAVENLAVKFDSEDPTKATLTFNVPTKSIAGVDLTEVTRIDVYKNDELLTSIDNPTPGTAQSCDIEAKMGEQIIYKIVPLLNETEGVPTELPVCILVAPYTNDFTGTKNLVGYSTFDLNRNGFGWSIYNGTARAFSAGELNDWLITPPVHLEGGYFYKVQYTTSLEAENENANATIGLYVGEEPSPEGMTRAASETYAPLSSISQMVLLKDYVWIEETGEYYFGWHAQGSGSDNLMIDNFSISDKINGGVPNKALDLTITPDKMGAMEGVISFTSPATTLKGEPLYGNIDYVVYRDGVAVYQTTTTPNKPISFTDKGMTQGVHLYSVYPTNTQGLGREAEDVAFFGINRPAVPENFNVRETDTYGTVLLTWDAPSTDYDGFAINPDLITYDIFIYNPDEGTETSVTTGLKTLSYTHKAKSPTDPQAFIRYGIRARTTMGGSPGLLAQYYVNVGEPYALPLEESFKGMTPKTALMSQSIDGVAAWGYSITDNAGVSNFDDDNGMALMEVMFAESEARLFTGKIRISGENPVMTFYVYNNKNLGDDTNVLSIEVGKPQEWNTCVSKTVDEWAGGLEGWQKVSVDLSDYRDQVVHISFRGKAMKYTFTHIDKIRIGEAGMDDLTLAQVDAPRRVNPGEEFTLNATVKNNGLADAEIYTLRMYREGELIKTIQGQNIKAGEVKVFDFTDKLDKNASQDLYTYSFDIRYSPDTDLSDNSKGDIQVSVRASSFLPMVTDLTASVNNENNVELNWSAPELQTKAQEITDDVESYGSWQGKASILGDWTNLDQDNSYIIYGSGLESLPIANRAKEGWFIMEATHDIMQAANETWNYEFYNTHSGDKCFAAAGLSDREAYTNDWLISPELSGEAQTVKFWARSCNPAYTENFVFMTSESNTHVRDFSEVAAVIAVPTEWTEYSYEVPAGTKYFAIRHSVMNSFYLMVDDITFTPAGSERLNIEGYQVYHDGELLETVDKSVAKFSHANLPDGNHNYAVAVKYDKGESADAQVSVQISGVGEVYTEGPAAYGMKGQIAISGADTMNVNIYNADGMHLYTTVGNDIITVAPGVYVVVIGTDSFKVIVK
ncbi:MAG: choice-of-anchor J domain-containing protein [Muribaculaceae bacterium]|nr:choice-of-anchor J domain-containing protein [Muribaculaceae bacterium]